MESTMIYLFDRACNDLKRVIITFSNEITKAKNDYESKTNLLQYFSEYCLGLDEINRDFTIQCKLNEVLMALCDGEVEKTKSHIERLEPFAKEMIPNSVLEFVGLDFKGKKIFNLANVDRLEYNALVRSIAIAFREGQDVKNQELEKKLYELVTKSEIFKTVENKMCDDELLDICAEYLKKSRDPEAHMILFLINQAKKA